MSHQFPEDVTAHLPDDFLWLFGDEKPIKTAPFYEVDQKGNSIKYYRVTCRFCGKEFTTKRSHAVYHPDECRQRMRRARKAYLDENWFGLVILYFIFIIIENIPSYEAKSNTAKS